MWKTLRAPLQPPSTLRQGDVRENIRRFAAEPMPKDADEASRLLTRLLDLGCLQDEITDAARWIGQVSLTTKVVKECHGSVAVARRLHPDLGADSLVMRGHLRSCRASLDGEAALRAQVLALVGEPGSLGQRAKHVLRSHMMGDEWLVKASVRRRGPQQLVMKKCAQKLTSSASQRGFGQWAPMHRCAEASRGRGGPKPCSHVALTLFFGPGAALFSKRQLAHLAHRVAYCSFSLGELRRLEHASLSSLYSHAMVGDILSETLAPPASIPPGELATLTSYANMPASSAKIPVWAKAACQNRTAFSSCIWYAGIGSHKSFLFLFAMQSPYHLEFLELARRWRCLPHLACGGCRLESGRPIFRQDCVDDPAPSDTSDLESLGFAAG